MEEKKYKKSAIKIIILFILAFTFIMFLPEIRTTIKVKTYEKEQKEIIAGKKEKEEKIEKKNTLSTLICSSTTDIEPNYSLSYNKNGLQKYTKITNMEVKENEEEVMNACKKEQEENDDGIETKCQIENNNLSKSVEYDFSKMTESYRKNNIFDFQYNETVEKIKNELESNGYTCG